MFKRMASFGAFALLLAVILYTGSKYLNLGKSVALPADIPVKEEAQVEKEVRIKAAVDRVARPNPDTTITPQKRTEDVKIEVDSSGNQVITQTMPKEIEQAPELVVIDVLPEPEAPIEPPKEQPKVEDKPVEQPKQEQPKVEQPKTEVKQEKPKVEKPKTETPKAEAKPKDGDRRVLDGQKQIYIEGFGWLEDNPGGTSIVAPELGKGEIVGY